MSKLSRKIEKEITKKIIKPGGRGKLGLNYKKEKQ